MIEIFLTSISIGCLTGLENYYLCIIAGKSVIRTRAITLAVEWGGGGLVFYHPRCWEGFVIACHLANEDEHNWAHRLGHQEKTSVKTPALDSERVLLCLARKDVSVATDSHPHLLDGAATNDSRLPSHRTPVPYAQDGPKIFKRFCGLSSFAPKHRNSAVVLKTFPNQPLNIQKTRKQNS